MSVNCRIHILQSQLHPYFWSGRYKTNLENACHHNVQMKLKKQLCPCHDKIYLPAGLCLLCWLWTHPWQLWSSWRHCLVHTNPRHRVCDRLEWWLCQILEVNHWNLPAHICSQKLVADYSLRSLALPLSHRDCVQSRANLLDPLLVLRQIYLASWLLAWSTKHGPSVIVCWIQMYSTATCTSPAYQEEAVNQQKQETYRNFVQLGWGTNPLEGYPCPASRSHRDREQCVFCLRKGRRTCVSWLG